MGIFKRLDYDRRPAGVQPDVDAVNTDESPDDDAEPDIERDRAGRDEND